MDRLLLDANVLFSAAYRPAAGVARLWELERVELLTSAYAAEEARLNLMEEDQRQARPNSWNESGSLRALRWCGGKPPAGR